MRVETVISRAEPETAPLDFSGQWKNELLSEMQIEQAGSSLSGVYKSYKNGAGEIAAIGDLVGWASGKLIVFSVNWKGLDSITSWIGQFVQDQDGPHLETLWQMTKTVPDGSEWESINAGADRFWRA